MVISKIKSYIRGQKLKKLKKKGVIVGENCHLINTTFDKAYPFLISIGDNVTITNSTILTHDASTIRTLNKSRIGRVDIGSRVFVGYNTIIMPNVRIGDDVIIAAGSVVTRDIPSNSIVAGVPAKRIATTDEYINKNRELFNKRPVFNTHWKSLTKEDKERIKLELENDFGFGV